MSVTEQHIKTEQKQYKTLWASTMGYAMDGLDMMILSFALPLLGVYFHLNGAEKGAIATITLLGAVIGGISFGILADKYGRVRVFSWTILLFSIFTGLGAVAPNVEFFTLFRFIAGLGLGGEFGIGMTLVAETWANKYRSRATAVVAIGFQIGIVLASLASWLILPHFGWRGLFLVGVVPALFVWWTRRNLTEPEIWVVMKNKHKNKNALTPLKSLFSNKKITLTTIGLIIATSVQNFGFYGIMTWMPTVLANEHHITLSGTTLWTIITIIGMILGTLVFGFLCDKIGRRPTFISFLIISSVFVWIYFQQTNYILMIALGGVLGFFVNGMMGGFGALLSEHYPTYARSTAQNVIFNLGRGVAGFAPLIIGYLSDVHTLSYALMLISGIYLLSALAFIFLIPETKGQTLQ